MAVDNRVPALVERMKAEILADMEAGTVPRGVGSFSRLHDYVDANEYGGVCEEGAGFAPDSDEDTAVLTAAQNLVDAWLQLLDYDENTQEGGK